MEQFLEVVGIQLSVNKKGETTTTLHMLGEFPDYYNVSEGKAAIGKMALSEYMGTIDCSHIEVGALVDVVYDKAVTTSKGTFQPVRRVDVIKQK